MKRVAILTVALVLLLLGGASAADSVLSNTDVVRMHQAKLSPDVIINTIKASQTNFDTSVDAIIELGKLGVPSVVIEVMQGGRQAAGTVVPGASTPAAALSGRIQVQEVAAPAAVVPTNFNGTPCPSEGLFAEAGSKLTKLQPRAATSGGGSSAMIGALSRGVIGQKSYVFLGGTEARLQLPDSTTTFLFCFGESEAGLSYQTEGAVVPDDFVLARFDVRGSKDKRRLQVGNIHLWAGNKMGVPDRDRVDFNVDELATGVYRVTPREALSHGEYAFYYASELGTAVWGISFDKSGKFFDFGVSGGTTLAEN